MADDYDQIQSAYFSFEVKGKVESTFFKEVSGIGYSKDTVEHKVTSKNKEIVRKIPGRTTWTDISLKKALAPMSDLEKWFKQVADGDVEGARGNGSITAFNQAGAIVANWDFENAWPSNISVGGLSSESGELITLDITIVHEGIYRTK